MERYALVPVDLRKFPPTNAATAVRHRAGSPTLAHPRRSNRAPGQDHAPTRRPRPPGGPRPRKIRLHQLHGKDDRGAEEEWEGESVKKNGSGCSLHSVAGHIKGFASIGVDVVFWGGVLCPLFSFAPGSSYSSCILGFGGSPSFCCILHTCL